MLPSSEQTTKAQKSKNEAVFMRVKLDTSFCLHAEWVHTLTYLRYVYNLFANFILK